VSLKSIRVLLFVLLCAGIGVGQLINPRQASDKSPSVKSLDALLDRVSGLPAEYKADLTFAVIDANPSSLSAARKRALLDDVFHSAVGAHFPYYLVDTAHHHQGRAPSVSYLMGSALFTLHSDSLDIQTRAIERALPLVPQFATHLFEELNVSEVRASCKDPAVVDLSAFYNTAAKIIEDKRIKTVFKQEKDIYLQSLTSGMRVPAQIAPLANLIAHASRSPEQLGQVEMAFVSSLGTITASDREISAAEKWDHTLTSAIGSLSTRLAQSGISSEPLIAAYRGFLVRSLTPERCADNSLDRAEIAKAFNTLLLNKTPESSNMSPLSDNQLSPKSTGDTASDEIVPFNEQLAPQLARISAAHEVRVAEQYRLGQSPTVEPEDSDVEDVVRYVTSQEPSGAECPVCDFGSKNSLLMHTIELLPAGHQLERLINAEVEYMSFNAIEKDNPTAWLFYFNKLINISRKTTDKDAVALTAQAQKGQQPWWLPSPEASVIRDSLRKSSDPIIATYMSAEDLLHPTINIKVNLCSSASSSTSNGHGSIDAVLLS
jgi:hypothetical protein